MRERDDGMWMCGNENGSPDEIDRPCKCVIPSGFEPLS